MYVHSEGIEVRQLFSTELALNIRQKGSIQKKKTYQIVKSEKYETFVSPSF